MSRKNRAASSDVTFISILTLLFIGLKLGEVIQWSWWWVLSPMIVDAALQVIVPAVEAGVRAYKTEVAAARTELAA